MTKFPTLSRAAFKAYDHLSLPVWMFSTETLRILSANAAAQSWIGYDARTLQEMTIADLRPEADRARIVEQVRRFDGTQADAGAWTIITRSGEHRTVSFTWSKVTFEGAEAIVASICDLTQITQVEALADTLSARLRSTLEGMHDAFFLLDENWQFAFINSTAEELLQRTRQNLLGKSVWQEFPEAVGSGFEENYQRAVAEGCAVRFEAYFSPLEKWFEVNADPTPAGLAVYFRDVTRQRARNMQLRLLEAAVDQQSDVLIITDASIEPPEGPRIVYVNDAFERATGYTREEAIGQTPRLQQGPGTSRATRARIRTALERGEGIETEILNYRKDGAAFWKDLSIHPLRNEDGQITHWIAVERDFTARKQVEEALRANEERFRMVAKSTGSAIGDWDLTTDTQWWSDGFAEITGFDPDETESFHAAWRDRVHKNDLENYDTAWRKFLSGEISELHERYRVKRPDGTWVLIEDHAFATRDEHGNVIRALGSITDVTEREKLEESLRQAQKMEAVGHLTGGVAHDFNNLLTIIMGNAEILEEKLRDMPHLQRLARMSLDAADRGADLTNRLLAFSRKQALDPKILDIAPLIQSMDVLLRRVLPETIDIEIVRSGGLWKIEADASQLESALLNLAVNARDAMPDGGSLTIETANAMLDDDYVAVEPDVRPGQYVVIIVTDTGTGMPPDVLARVFEPFFTTKEVGKGSGMGLSMVFGFVKQSGGHIRVYSEMDEGTAIKMYFPRARTEEENVAIVNSGRKITGGTETILVVEDDGAVRDYVSAQLKSLGYNVLEASAGAEAMDILGQTAQIDLLFTDVVMPGGMGGRELAEAARQLRPNLKVLFTSGYTENSIVHQGRLDPGVKLLNKPYRREHLAAKIRQVLDERE
ncbi:PAS domain S-box protein [Lutimaribacter sp. EGI FJ00015]|uniref:PAS domain S-box protein n=1 Tax=Lutimaribacter degradans TaxID=2945989 RepID=A0ACC5ZZZ7_9RHOB|nr:PAS domain S-box protein [Lutimaribacter sp. EGI FJ00013]MCM2563671.1 PAS domain S-box protein [Lutimaribacter sp. EGI FJ00013]MCO0614854.1 PAS domain S-box protein [Lutimaribacter sp. EGI FJ00015]MCO0637523.1 PAS domain S-box protein [Lutimaribacter sp. EGI FJ00014]